MTIKCTPTGLEITTSREHLSRMADSLKAVAGNSVGWFRLNFTDAQTSLTFIAEDDPLDPTAKIEYDGAPLTHE